MHKTISLLGVHVSCVNPAKAKALICQWVKAQALCYVCVAPASTLVEARQNSTYQAVINAAAMVTPDGMPVVWLAKLKGCKDIERTYGPDLMRDLCREAGLKHFFYGSSADTIARMIGNLKIQNPRLDVVGTHAPDYQPRAMQEQKAVIAAINQARPDILWVALGSPKQDFWMHIHRPLLTVPVMVGVGAAFDFIAQVKPQAPRWMQQAGLEWLFRLCCEPRRLWKRYLVGNMLFIFYAIKELLKRP